MIEKEEKEEKEEILTVQEKEVLLETSEEMDLPVIS